VTLQPRDEARRARRYGVVCLVSVLIGSAGHSMDGAPTGAAAAGRAGAASAKVAMLVPDGCRPRILGGFDARTRSRLASAFQLAARRLADLPTCSELFTRLGADGRQKLQAIRYQSVADVGGERVCGRGLGAAAFTTVGNLRTVVCPGFDRLDIDEAAVIVLHEALHGAGLTEWPLDRDAPNGGEINRTIRLACDL